MRQDNKFTTNWVVDDGLIFKPRSSSPKASKLQKKIMRAFRSLGLRINISFKLSIFNFLDVTFILDNTFKPFNKNTHPPTYLPTSMLTRTTLDL